MAVTGRLRDQCRPDHLDSVRAAQQARHRQQHMPHQTHRAPRPARSQHPDTAHFPLPGMAPRRERARAARARQLTCTQPPLDLDRVRTYHDHGASTSTKQRPSLPAKESEEGRCASRTWSHCRRTPTRSRPEAAPVIIIALGVATPPPDRHAPRRSTAARGQPSTELVCASFGSAPGVACGSAPGGRGNATPRST
jgi:hypothetical protein